MRMTISRSGMPNLDVIYYRKRPSVLNGSNRHRPGGIRAVEEREIYALREQLKHYPAAVRAILDAARHLHRPVETLSPRDVEAGQ